MSVILIILITNLCTIFSYYQTSTWQFYNIITHQKVIRSNLFMKSTPNSLSTSVFSFPLLQSIRKKLFPTRDVVINGLNNIVKDQIIKDKISSSKLKDQIIKDEASSKVIISTDVAIIGAGMAGLSCGKLLESNGFSNYTIIESCNKVGGRIQSDIVDGYILDRGFQVFIDSYPESIKLFNYSALRLKPFLPGAIIRWDNSFHVVSDPFRRPQDLFASVVSPIGTLLDKIKIGLLTITIKTDSIADIFSRSEYSTEEYLLNQKEVSYSMIDRFFKPFYQGIFLSPLNSQSSRMFEFVFKMFSEGSATLPEYGMGMIPQQIADDINKNKNKIMLNTRVESIQEHSEQQTSSLLSQSQLLPPVFSRYSIRTKNHKTNEVVYIHSSKIVIAADPINAKKLLDKMSKKNNSSNNNSSSSCSEDLLDIPKGRGSTCIYFGFDGSPPISEAVLILNGNITTTSTTTTSATSTTSLKNIVSESKGGISDITTSSLTINNVCFPSQVSSKYAPEGKSLASITIIGCISDNYSDEDLEQNTKKQLKDWFGDTVDTWKLLKIYRIPYAQPSQSPPYDLEKTVTLSLSSSSTTNNNDNINNDSNTTTSNNKNKNNLYCIGDHRNTATLNGAIASGRIAAELILNDI